MVKGSVILFESYYFGGRNLNLDARIHVPHSDLKLNANFPGQLSALQLFSHPSTQLPLIIGLPCETYSRVSPGKLFLSPFQAAYIKISRLGNSRLEQTPPYQGTHLYTWVKRSKRVMNFLRKKIGWSGRNS